MPISTRPLDLSSCKARRKHWSRPDLWKPRGRLTRLMLSCEKRFASLRATFRESSESSIYPSAYGAPPFSLRYGDNCCKSPMAKCVAIGRSPRQWGIEKQCGPWAQPMGKTPSLSSYLVTESLRQMEVWAATRVGSGAKPGYSTTKVCFFGSTKGDVVPR